jgi:hypothetical protein
MLSLTGSPTFNGSNAIIDFCRPFSAAADETVDIEFRVMGDTHRGSDCHQFRARKVYRPLPSSMSIA